MLPSTEIESKTYEKDTSVHF